MKIAKRVENLPPYLFVEISKKIAEKKAKGEEVISFGIGDPDIPTPPHIINRLIEAARDPVNHRYQESEGQPEHHVGRDRDEDDEEEGDRAVDPRVRHACREIHPPRR